MKFEIQRFADSGFLKDNLKGFVPTEISYKIIENVVQSSAVLRLSNVEVMNSESKKFSVLKNSLGAYWVEESKRISTSVPEWDFPEITAKKLGVIVPVTKEKDEDTVINVFEEVQPKIVAAFHKAIDEACLFGTGSPFASSILSVATANSMAVALGTNAKLDLDISDVMALIEAKGYDVDGFVSNIAFKNQLRKLRDGNGNQLYVQGVDQETLYSLPIEFVRNGGWDATKALCIAGNWDYSVVGIRSDITYEVLREATLTTVTMADGAPLNLAERDMIALKATMRIGFVPVKGDAFALLTPAASSSSSSSSGAGEGSGSGDGTDLGD